MPSYQAQQTVYGAAFAATILGALTVRPAGPLFATLKVRLNTLPGFNPLPNATVASLVANEANFVGYTAGGYAPTWSGLVNLSSTILGILSNVTPICSGAAAPSPNTVFGYWVDDGTNMIVAEAFAGGASYGFSNPGDFLDLQVNIPFQLFQQL